MVVEIEPTASRTQPADVYVPKFYRESDHRERSMWTWKHADFIDNLCEALSDHLTSKKEESTVSVEIDHAALRKAVSDYVFDTSIRARRKHARDE